MKLRHLPLAVILVVAMVVPTIVGAQGETLPGSGWWTGQQIQNIGTADATIVSTAYDAHSAATYMASAGPVSSFASVTFLPADFSGMPNGFEGSAVVASDQPIKAIVALTNRKVGSYGVDGGLASGQYQGIDGAAAATTVRFPIAKNNFSSKTSTFYVQNAGSAAGIVHASYVCASGTYTQDSASINAGQMAVMSPAAVVPSGQLCSATMTSGQPIAGVAVEHWNSEVVATLAQATRGFTPDDYAGTIYAPIFKRRFPMHAVQGRTTGAQIQNVSAGNITVTATYYFSGGTCPSGTWSETSPSIAAGASYVFLNPSGMVEGCLASAKFVGNGGDIVGVVNESFLSPIPPVGTQSSTAYNMLADTSATPQIAAPLYKEQFGGKTTGLQVQNVGAANATIHLEFRSGATVWTTVNKTVTPGASYVFLLVSGDPTLWSGTVMPAGTNAAVRIYSDQPVLAIASEQTYPICYATANCYDRLNYEGFNITP